MAAVEEKEVSNAFMSQAYAHHSVEKEPNWCSIDLGEGQQSLPVPLTINDKVALFQLLVGMGFKTIEIGHPGAYDCDYQFARLLIEDGLCPDDVTLCVTSAMKSAHLCKALDAVKGAAHARLNLFHSTAMDKRKYIPSGECENALVDKAVKHFLLAKEHAKGLHGTKLSYQYSLESFNSTEPLLLLKLIQAVEEVVYPSIPNEFLVNFWMGCDSDSPHLLISRIGGLIEAHQGNPNTGFSLRAHNDRGNATALAEMALLAGVTQIEGGLFGLGYRAGSTCLATLAINLQRMDLPVSLNLPQLAEAKTQYESLTSHQLSKRHPYVGEYALSSFAPHEQYAIYKAMLAQKESDEPVEQLPYVPLRPCQIGRSYDKLIRVNALSGRTGIAHVLQTKYGFQLPGELQSEFSTLVKEQALDNAMTMSEEGLWGVFAGTYLRYEKPLCLHHVGFDKSLDGEALVCQAVLSVHGKSHELTGRGTGAMDALCEAVKTVFSIPFEISEFYQHALGSSSKARAVAYLKLTMEDDRTLWGVGIDNDATLANISALISALNRLMEQTDDRTR